MDEIAKTLILWLIIALSSVGLTLLLMWGLG